ncbi:MAG: hypothetical protein HW380_406 [Magnetococcales bacterium]|nr:hypothetical protein [Magnetococcales bacterium]HIJ83610.1 hypothetical protein [Magnetococcales bacterium]
MIAVPAPHGGHLPALFFIYPGILNEEPCSSDYTVINEGDVVQFGRRRFAFLGQDDLYKKLVSKIDEMDEADGE